jgi:molybdenum cofactor synthesis domain-containing protein
MSAQAKDNPKTLRAALIIIGNEILSGRTQDTNTQFIAEKLSGRGIALREVRVVPDIEAKIIEAVRALKDQVNYVFTTGGIGPTHDDITAESIAKAFGTKLYSNPEAKAVMEAYYGGEWNEARLKMTMIPEGAKLIPNPVSGAPGFIMGNVHVMAGVPRIMQGMLETMLPFLDEGAKILTNTVACSLRESVIAEALTNLQKRYSDVDIGSYPQYRKGPHNLSLVLRSIHEEKLKTATSELMQIIRDLDDEPHAVGLQAIPDDLV